MRGRPANVRSRMLPADRRVIPLIVLRVVISVAIVGLVAAFQFAPEAWLTYGTRNSSLESSLRNAQHFSSRCRQRATKRAAP